MENDHSNFIKYYNQVREQNKFMPIDSFLLFEQGGADLIGLRSIHKFQIGFHKNGYKIQDNINYFDYSIDGI